MRCSIVADWRIQTENRLRMRLDVLHPGALHGVERCRTSLNMSMDVADDPARDQTLGLRIDAALLAAIERLAARDHRTVSSWVRKLLIERVEAEGSK